MPKSFAMYSKNVRRWTKSGCWLHIWPVFDLMYLLLFALFWLPLWRGGERD